MYEKDEVIQFVEGLVGEKYVILHSETSQVLGVEGWNQYGDMKQVFDSPEEVADAWFELGMHEMEEAKRAEYEIVSFADAVTL